MSDPELESEITRKVHVDADFDRHRAVISCETKEGKSIHLDVDFETLQDIHDQIQERLADLWGQ